LFQRSNVDLDLHFQSYLRNAYQSPNAAANQAIPAEVVAANARM
jgi:hypothetical protein